MIDEILGWVEKHLPVKQKAEEDDLRRRVKEEHRQGHLRRARAARVLEDFHRADTVVSGVARGEPR